MDSVYPGYEVSNAGGQGKGKGKHIAPHTIEIAEMWAFLVRLDDFCREIANYLGTPHWKRINPKKFTLPIRQIVRGMVKSGRSKYIPRGEMIGKKAGLWRLRRK